MKLLIIQHAKHESPGIILDWIEENKHSYKIVRPYLGEEIKKESDFDFLIILGGPQSPILKEKYPYLKDEIEFTALAIKNLKYVLGICLGSQIITEALGYKTFRSPESEFGVYPITFSDDALTTKQFKDFSKKLNVLHWHNDMPEIPTCAIKISSSVGCPNQGFIYNNKIIGLQFHMQVRNKDLIELINVDSNELKRIGRFIQTEDELAKTDLSQMNNLMIKFLNKFTSGAI